MTNDNDLLLLASASQNIKPFEVYIDSNGKKTLTPKTSKYTAIYPRPYVYLHLVSNGTELAKEGLLIDEKPKKVIFPNCSKITGINTTERTGAGGFAKAFQGCTSLTSVSFPALTTVTGGAGSIYSEGAFEDAFWDCTSLTSVSFPVLTTATGGKGSGSYNDGAFSNAFTRCTSLTSVSFPSLTTITTGTNPTATFYMAFQNCSPSLKVHFKKSMKGKEGLKYYKTMGLTSADQVVFDLP